MDELMGVIRALLEAHEARGTGAYNEARFAHRRHELATALAEADLLTPEDAVVALDGDELRRELDRADASRQEVAA